jgi:hypothetical protein
MKKKINFFWEEKERNQLIEKQIQIKSIFKGNLGIIFKGNLDFIFKGNLDFI